MRQLVHEGRDQVLPIFDQAGIVGDLEPAGREHAAGAERLRLVMDQRDALVDDRAPPRRLLHEIDPAFPADAGIGPDLIEYPLGERMAALIVGKEMAAARDDQGRIAHRIAIGQRADEPLEDAKLPGDGLIVDHARRKRPHPTDPQPPVTSLAPIYRPGCPLVTGSYRRAARHCLAAMTLTPPQRQRRERKPSSRGRL